MTKEEKNFILDYVALQTGFASNEQLIKKLFLNFLKQRNYIMNMFEELDNSIKSRDIDLTKDLVHSIKGLVIEIYAVRMKNIVDKMEYLCKNNNTVDFNYLCTLYNDLIKEYSYVHEYAKQYIQRCQNEYK